MTMSTRFKVKAGWEVPDPFLPFQSKQKQLYITMNYKWKFTFACKDTFFFSWFLPI